MLLLIIINSKGYEITNIVLCCTRCNKIKSSQLTYEDSIEIGKILEKRRLTPII